MGVLKFFLPLVFVGLVVAEPRWLNGTDGHNYLVNSEQKYNWFTAAKECSRRNLQLVEIESEDKNQEVVRLLQAAFGKSVDLWLGANDEFNKKQDYKRPFYWRSSGKRMGYTYWSADNPNNGRTVEHCVHTWAKSENFKWNDLDCADTIGYICEEQPVRQMYRKAMQEKGNKVMEISRKLFKNQQEEQQKVMNELNDIMSLIEEKNEEIGGFLQRTHSDLEGDLAHEIDLHNREVLTYVTDTLKKARELDEKLKNAANQMHSQFSKDFDKAQEVIDYVLGNINVSYQ